MPTPHWGKSWPPSYTLGAIVLALQPCPGPGTSGQARRGSSSRLLSVFVHSGLLRVCRGVSDILERVVLCCMECPGPGVLGPRWWLGCWLPWGGNGGSSTAGGGVQVQAQPGGTLPRSGGTPGHPGAEQARDQNHPLPGTKERGGQPTCTPPLGISHGNRAPHRSTRSWGGSGARAVGELQVLL